MAEYRLNRVYGSSFLTAFLITSMYKKNKYYRISKQVAFISLDSEFYTCLTKDYKQYLDLVVSLSETTFITVHKFML